MLLIVTALRAEAKPLIADLELSAVSGTIPPIYANDDYALVITGVGRVRAAAGVGYCFGKFPDISAVVNVGLAGSTTVPIGDLFLVNAVHDATTDRRFHPDPMTELGLSEDQLTTCDKVVQSGDAHGLVDMEGAAVFDTASRYLPPHRILLLKVVSDDCKGTTPDAKHATEIMEKQVSAIGRALGSIAAMAADKVDPLDACSGTVDALAENLRLTASQRVQLEDACRDRLLNINPDWPDLTAFLTEPVTTKQEGKTRLAQLIDTLLDA